MCMYIYITDYYQCRVPTPILIGNVMPFTMIKNFTFVMNNSQMLLGINPLKFNCTVKYRVFT